MQPESSFGRWLKQRRKARDLSIAEVARHVGCSASTLRKLEIDARRPSRQVAERLAVALDIPTEQRGAFVQRARAHVVPTPPRAASQSLPWTLPPVPVPSTPLLGRAAELAAACALLRAPMPRLLTFTGPGGTGKTRVSLEVARVAAPDFRDGVAFVALGAITDAALVASAIGEVLGLTEQGGRPIEAVLGSFLRDKHLLLVLDNFEQVLAAASVIAELLAAAPQLKVVVTSRTSLHVTGEQECPVLPLPVPDLEQALSTDGLLQYAAIELFVQRVTAVSPDFHLADANGATVADICVRLDGLPLAIELVATRVKVLSLAALRTRLEDRLTLLTAGARDLPARQHTLRATIAWSVDLLDPEARDLFARLAVFAGGWTLDAAEAVCAAPDNNATSVMDGLARLIDHSLVQQTTTASGELRFRMLETIRAFALEHLTGSGEQAALQRRHAGFFLHLAEAAEPMLLTAQRTPWLARLMDEHDNLRTALAWCRSATDGAEIGIELAGALWLYFYYRGQVSEGRSWLEGILTWSEAQRGAPGTGMDLAQASRPLARALVAAAVLAFLQGDLHCARIRQEASERLCRQLDDQPGLVMALTAKGMVALVEGDTAAAHGYAEEGVALARDIGGTWLLGFVLWHWGSVLQAQGKIAHARTVFEESLPMFRAVNEWAGLSMVSSDLGWLAYQQQDYATAQAYFRTSLAVHTQHGKLPVAMCLEHLAAIAGVQGRLEHVAVLLGAANALRSAVGTPALTTDIAVYAPAHAAARDQLGEVTFATAWATGRAMSLASAVAYALEIDV